MATMHDDIDKVLFSEEKIAEIVQNMGRQISEDYKGKNLFMVAHNLIHYIILKRQCECQILFKKRLSRNFSRPV